MHKTTPLLILAAGITVGTVVPAFAQSDALERMGKLQPTGTSYQDVLIEQGGSKAEQINKNLERINLPPGFKIGLYAIVPDARHMTMAPQGTVVFVGTRKADVYAVMDRDKDRVADDVQSFASPLDFRVPNGVCFTPDGFLYLVEHDRVLNFHAAEFFHENPDVVAEIVVPQGELIPPEEESFNHGARVCRIGPDNKLYISLGQPYNVPPPEKAELYNKWGLGGIIRMDRNGANRDACRYNRNA